MRENIPELAETSTTNQHGEDETLGSPVLAKCWNNFWSWDCPYQIARAGTGLKDWVGEKGRATGSREPENHNREKG